MFKPKFPTTIAELAFEISRISLLGVQATGYNSMARDLKEIESALLEGRGTGEDLQGVVVDEGGVVSDGRQVGQQSLKAVNGLAIVGSLGMDFRHSFGGAHGGSNDGIALGLSGSPVMVIEENRS